HSIPVVNTLGTGGPVRADRLTLESRDGWPGCSIGSSGGRCRVWQVMSRGRDPGAGQPPRERVHVDYPLWHRLLRRPVSLQLPDGVPLISPLEQHGRPPAWSIIDTRLDVSIASAFTARVNAFLPVLRESPGGSRSKTSGFEAMLPVVLDHHLKGEARWRR